MVCDTHYLIQFDQSSPAQEFRLEYLGDILEKKEGMYSTIATITNFLMQFPDDHQILASTFIILRRLYNFFPKYRKNLEEPLILILVNILRAFKNSKMSYQNIEISSKMFDSACNFMHYLMNSKETTE